MRGIGLLILFSPAVVAQPAPAPIEQAWFAHRIAQSREAGHEAALITLSRSHDLRVQNAALDALIQTGAVLTSDQLSALSRDFPDQRLILAAFARKAGTEVFWEVARQDGHPDHWVTALNLLSTHGTRGLARYLLAEWTVTATLVVTDTDEPLGMAGSSGAGGGGGGIYPLAGFPPPVYYNISIHGHPGDTLLATGPFPSYYRRTTTQGFQIARFDRDYMRQRYLAEILGWPADRLAPQSRTYTQYVWRSLSGFESAVQELVETRQREYRGLIQLLRERELLGADEMEGLHSRLRLQFTDNRQVKSPALPPPRETEFTAQPHLDRF